MQQLRRDIEIAVREQTVHPRSLIPPPSRIRHASVLARSLTKSGLHEVVHYHSLVCFASEANLKSESEAKLKFASKRFEVKTV